MELNEREEACAAGNGEALEDAVWPFVVGARHDRTRPSVEVDDGRLHHVRITRVSAADRDRLAVEAEALAVGALVKDETSGSNEQPVASLKIASEAFNGVVAPARVSVPERVAIPSLTSMLCAPRV